MSIDRPYRLVLRQKAMFSIFQFAIFDQAGQEIGVLNWPATASTAGKSSDGDDTGCVTVLLNNQHYYIKNELVSREPHLCRQLTIKTDEGEALAAVRFSSKKIVGRQDIKLVLPQPADIQDCSAWLRWNFTVQGTSGSLGRVYEAKPVTLSREITIDLKEKNDALAVLLGYSILTYKTSMRVLFY